MARPVGVELLFTTAEELALRGAKEVDRARLRSEFGFVFDHASPIGELIVAAPTYFRLEARFHGAAAHAGIRPEDGRSAIAAAAARPSPRCGSAGSTTSTTANAGTIEGGTAANVVAERCRVELEARSLDDDAAGRVDRRDGGRLLGGRQRRGVRRGDRGGAALPRLPAAAHGAARAGRRGRARVAGHRARRTSPTGGGSDANALIAAGLPVLNVANGTERNHQPDESVTVEALETMLDVTLAIVDASAQD